jgi:hypothetical protein
MAFVNKSNYRSNINLTNIESNNEINNRKISKNEINTFIEQIDTTNEISKLIPELIRFKETWKTFSDDKKKYIIIKIKSIVKNKNLLKYLQKYNENIGKNNDTRFTTVFKLLDLLIHKRHNFNVAYPQDVIIINNRNEFEDLIYRLKHIKYPNGNTSTPQFTIAANQFIKTQLNRSGLPQQNNKLISILLNNTYFNQLLEYYHPTKKDYFAWVDKTFGI